MRKGNRGASKVPTASEAIPSVLGNTKPRQFISNHWAPLRNPIVVAMALSIATIEELAALSQHMLDAARNGDSAEFGRLSMCVEALGTRAEMQRADLGETPESRAIRVRLVHRILDNDARIRRLKSPLPPFIDAMLAAGSVVVPRGRTAVTLD